MIKYISGHRIEIRVIIPLLGVVKDGFIFDCKKCGLQDVCLDMFNEPLCQRLERYLKEKKERTR